MIIKRPCHRAAFSLIELIVVVAIIALLVNLSAPSLGKAIAKAKSIKCADNLRQIGVAVNLAASENNNTYPEIEADPSNPIYPASDNAKDLADTLAPYGVTSIELRCPSDVNKEYLTRGSSYQWRPVLDDELSTSPYVYIRGNQIPVASSRVRILMDWDAVHSGRNNTLYGDGRTRSY